MGGALERDGMVEVVSSLERDGSPVFRDLRWGVYVVLKAPNEYARTCFKEYGLKTDASGGYAAMYKPYHLIGLELGISVLSAALRGEPTGQPQGWRGDVVAVAKRDLRAGEMLDGEGGYTVWGKLVPAERSLAEGALPIGLAHHVPLKCDIAAGEIVRWADVAMPRQRRRCGRVARWSRRFAVRPSAMRRNREERMEYRQFGRTDLKVSAIGFGCWEIGGTYGRIDESEFQRAVAQAIDSGITCFDTAEAYGMGVSEEALARALGPRRNDVVIATKFGVGYEEMPNRRDSSRARVLASIDKSLQRLAHRPCRRSISCIGPIPIRRSTRRWQRSTTSCGRARHAMSASQISAWRRSKRRCGCAVSMSCNTPGTCSTAACRPRSFLIVRRNKSP